MLMTVTSSGNKKKCPLDKRSLEQRNLEGDSNAFLSKDSLVPKELQNPRPHPYRRTSVIPHEG